MEYIKIMINDYDIVKNKKKHTLHWDCLMDDHSRAVVPEILEGCDDWDHTNLLEVCPSHPTIVVGFLVPLDLRVDFESKPFYTLIIFLTF